LEIPQGATPASRGRFKPSTQRAGEPVRGAIVEAKLLLPRNPAPIITSATSYPVPRVQGAIVRTASVEVRIFMSMEVGMSGTHTVNDGVSPQQEVMLARAGKKVRVVCKIAATGRTNNGAPTSHVEVHEGIKFHRGEGVKITP
jgi:hypothetical protein